MPIHNLSHFFHLPEVKISEIKSLGKNSKAILCSKAPRIEYCPRCAQPSSVTYDHRTVRVKDAPVRNHMVYLFIKKRRLFCKACKKPFTEPVPGVRKRKRHTDRFERHLTEACNNFCDLKTVRRFYRCSGKYLYQTYYRQLELRSRMHNSPWSKSIAIDEHSFRRNKRFGHTEFASVIVDYSSKRVKEIVQGKTIAALVDQLSYIPGRENVKNVVIDMCDPFKTFARDFFPNARITADKFHVLRLISPSLLRKRKEITGTRAELRVKKLLMMSSKNLDYFSRLKLEQFLQKYPHMQELYYWKESLHRFYRMRGYEKAAKALTRMTDQMSRSALPEIKSLRKTLMKWREEILNYFITRLTNARTEGFNNKAKLVKRRGYGYRNFENYRLRLLNACS